MIAVITFHASAIALVWTLINAVGVGAAFATLIDVIGDRRALHVANGKSPIKDFYTRQLIARNSIRVCSVRLVTLLAFAGIGIDSMFIPPSPNTTTASIIFALVFIALALTIIYDTFAGRRTRARVIAYYLEEKA